jgi:hypothetical protein
MKWYLSFAILLCGFLTIQSAAQEIARQRFQPIKPHPRILLTEKEEERIRMKLSSDVTYNFLHKIIIKECNALLTTAPVQRIVEGRRLLRTSREALRRIFFLAYSYRVTGEDRYLKRAEKELLTVANFSDWNPSHFLDAAEMTMGVAIGYDWLYNDLSEESRKVVENAILTKGLEPSLIPANSGWLTATHNWNQVCNASMSYGAIALLDRFPDISRKILNRSLKSVVLAMDEYLPDGGYPEGYGYWSYGTSFNVLLISALEKAFDDDFGLASHPGFVKTPYYLLNMTGPSGLPFNYSDCTTNANLNPAMAWFAAREKDPTIMTFEKKLIDGHKNLHRIRELPALMVWAIDLDLSSIPLPQSNVWIGKGRTPVALMRSGWDADKSIYVGLKGGKATTTHAHMDAGSFVVDALGERWAMDLGVQDYNSLESKGVKLWMMKQESDRWKVFRLSNHSHNTLTFNNGLQNVDGVASIVSSTQNPSFISATVDLSQVYNSDVKEARRGVAIVDNNYVVVQDEIELANQALIRWNLLTDAHVNILDNKTAELMKKGKKMILRISEPSDAVFTTWSTDPPRSYDEPNPGTVFIGFEVQRKVGEKFTFSVLMVPQDVTLENKMAIPELSEWPAYDQLK